MNGLKTRKSKNNNNEVKKANATVKIETLAESCFFSGNTTASSYLPVTITLAIEMIVMYMASSPKSDGVYNLVNRGLTKTGIAYASVAPATNVSDC